MGRRAYGLYLWNWPLAVLFGILAVPLTFVAAELSWRLIEQPLTHRRTARMRLGATSPVPAVVAISPIAG